MSAFSYFRAPQELEAYLGDPTNPEHEFSFQRAVERDEHEQYPEEACAFLENWGVHLYYIPEEYGGKLTSFEELLLLMRVVTRRDLTIAIAHGGTFLGAIAIWIAGSEDQKHQLARIVKARGRISLGLTERQHGGDLLANETLASPVAGGYLLSGEKWLIGNATHSRAITVFARTQQSAGPRGFSLLLVEKDRLDAASFTYLPKEKTLGIRGTDISGIRFHSCFIDHSAVIGSARYGLEITLKGLQITRTLVAGFSLGAADTALRTAMDFALERRVYGHTVFEIPYARMLLIEAFTDVLMSECVAISAVRLLHIAPAQMSVWSAVVKYFVPTTVEGIIHNLSIVLGARYYLRTGLNAGIFQKIVRDNAITSLFDGSTVVNLQAIGLQLRSLVHHRARTEGSQNTPLWTRLEAIFCLEKPLQRFDAKHLELFNHGQDDIMQGLEPTLKALQSLKPEGAVTREVLERIIELAKDVLTQVHAQDELLLELAQTYGQALNQSPRLYELAKDQVTLHAASACLQIWLHNHKLLGEFFASGEWLVFSLHRLLKPLQISKHSIPDSYIEKLAAQLFKLTTENKLFSIHSFPLSGRETRQ
ncbi:acyl-CoA dehydrogenase [Dictyobacter sp. S3.2.2.5]|uniref:Acyl-CoA dehydrogenase n=1 Tax=Dictyobacter halimunensis TaxID=3026934 RepID=A0ABQ6FII6_9CHLR|nr:acyl-CoA dehydrogenase [Dictyobacter sp. S3.2.2.5]